MTGPFGAVLFVDSGVGDCFVPVHDPYRCNEDAVQNFQDREVFPPCHGSCSGDVEIAEGGFFECHGSMSGNVTNNGGGYEIHGSFSGEEIVGG